VNLRNDKQYYQDGLFVFPINTFNERVVREALLNAVTHRSYQIAGSVFVRQYRDRLVVESPGGFPYGITIENILDRQSPRNFLIAQIFQLCGLVERSGQGMNLIYELAVREAKALPDFSGTDACFVKLTLNGILDKRMLSLIKNIGDERLNAMTTDDYILLTDLFHGKELERIKRERFEHLSELGIVKHTENSIELANGIHVDTQLIKPIDNLSIDTIDRRRLIIDYVAANGQVTTLQISKFTNLSTMRVRQILQELAADGVVIKVGNYRYTTYKLKDTGE
jgi:ATP-dependent DNA helicase RecG